MSRLSIPVFRRSALAVCLSMAASAEAIVQGVDASSSAGRLASAIEQMISQLPPTTAGQTQSQAMQEHVQKIIEARTQLLTDLYKDQSSVYFPTSRSQWIHPGDPVTSFPLILGDKGYPLASLSTQAGGRAIAYGSNLLSDLSGTAKGHIPLFKRAVQWLVTGSADGRVAEGFRVSIVGPDANTSLAGLRDAGFLPADAGCNPIVDAGCASTVQLLVVNTQVPDDAQMAEKIKALMQAGVPILYVNDTDVSSSSKAGRILLGMGLLQGPRGGNAWDNDQVSTKRQWDQSVELAARYGLPEQVQPILEARNQLLTDLYKDQSSVYVPGAASQWVMPGPVATSFPLIVGEKGYPLASVSTQGGGRAIAYGSNLLSTLPGSAKAHIPLFQRAFQWLMTGSAEGRVPENFKVSIVGPNVQASLNGLKAAGFSAVNANCDAIFDARCASSIQLLLLDNQVASDTKLSAKIKALMLAGVPILYVNDEGAGSVTMTGQILRGMGLQQGPRGGNNFDKDQVPSERLWNQSVELATLYGLPPQLTPDEAQPEEDTAWQVEQARVQAVIQARKKLLTSIYKDRSSVYAPGPDSQWMIPFDATTSFPLIVGDKGYPLASISVEGRSRALAYGSSVLWHLPGSAKEHIPVFQRAFQWLMTGTAEGRVPRNFKVSIVGPNSWGVISGLREAGFAPVDAGCNAIADASCASRVQLLMVDRDASGDAKLAERIKALRQAGVPILYFNDEGSGTRSVSAQLLNGLSLRQGPDGGNSVENDQVPGTRQWSESVELAARYGLPEKVQPILEARSKLLTALYQDQSSVYVPGNNSQWIIPGDPATTFPLIVGDKGYPLASISTQGGGRAIAYGISLLRALPGNAKEHIPLFKRAFQWLMTGSAEGRVPENFKVSIVGPNVSASLNGLKAAGFTPVNANCNAIADASCAGDVQLLLVDYDAWGSDQLSERIKALMEAGLPVIYFNDEGSGIKDVSTKLLRGMGLYQGPRDGNSRDNDQVPSTREWSKSVELALHYGLPRKLTAEQAQAEAEAAAAADAIEAAQEAADAAEAAQAVEESAAANDPASTQNKLIDAALISGDISQLPSSTAVAWRLVKHTEAIVQTRLQLLEGLYEGVSSAYKPPSSSQLPIPASPDNSFPLIVGEYGNPLASISQQGGGRAIAYGTNLLRLLPTSMAEHTPLFKRVVQWLVTGNPRGQVPETLNVSIVGPSVSPSLSALRHAGFSPVDAQCNALSDPSCAGRVHLLLLDYDATANGPLADKVREAMKAGVPIMYLHASGGDRRANEELIMRGLGLYLAGNNWWWDDFVPSTRTSAESIRLAAYYAQGSELAKKAAEGRWSTDPNWWDTTQPSGREFIAQAEGLKASIDVYNLRGLDLFTAPETTSLRLWSLWADMARKRIHYPMDKSRDVTQFQEALLADHLISYVGTAGTAQGDLGNYATYRQASMPVSTTEETLTITLPQASGFTAIGRTAVPGKRLIISAQTEPGAWLALGLNTQRSKTPPLWNADGYTRPRYVKSPAMDLHNNVPMAVVTPYGGLMQLHYSGAKPGQKVTIKVVGVAKHPFLDMRPGQDNSQTIADFTQAFNMDNADWMELRSGTVEARAQISMMREALSGDIQTFVDEFDELFVNGAYSLAGFAIPGRPLSPNILQACQALGWDCTDEQLHRMPGTQHINVDVHAQCGSGCAGNPYDQTWALDPRGWGESHEVGHNLQVSRLYVYGSNISDEVSNQIFPLQKNWRVFNLYGEDNGAYRVNYRKAFDLINAGRAEADPVDGVYKRLWQDDGYAVQNGERMAFYTQWVHYWADMKADSAQAWDVWTMLYLHQRLVGGADWSTNKAKLGYGTYASRPNGDGNDNLLIALSWLTQRDQRPTFAMWGIRTSAAAQQQVAAYGFPVQPAFFYANKTTNDYSSVIRLDMSKGTPAWPFP